MFRCPHGIDYLDRPKVAVPELKIVTKIVLFAVHGFVKQIGESSTLNVRKFNVEKRNERVGIDQENLTGFFPSSDEEGAEYHFSCGSRDEKQPLRPLS